MTSHQVGTSAAPTAAASLSRASDPSGREGARADTNQQSRGRKQGRGRLSVRCWAQLVTFTLLGSLPGQASETAYQVKDINQARQKSGSNPCNFTLANGRVYFLENISPGCNDWGSALHSTDATAAGTATVWSAPTPNAVVLDGHVFDGDYYYQTSVPNPGQTFGYTSTIHRTDGTPQGSAEIFSTLGYPGDLVAVGGRQIFVVQYIPPAGDLEVWSTDGTPDGTVRLLHHEGSQTSVYLDYHARLGGRLVFTANRYDTGVTELLATDGTPGGTFLLLEAQAGTEIIYGETSGTQFGNDLLFSTSSYETGASQLWKTDGTPQGTELIAQLDGYRFVVFHPAQGQVYFTALDSTTYATSLWRTDATSGGTRKLLDLVDYDGYFNPIFLMGSRGYFTTNDPATGVELWTSDGTVAGTVLVKDINPATDGSDPKNPVPQSSRPFSFMDLDGTLHFLANDGTNGLQFWTSDGTPGGTTAVTQSMPQDIWYWTLNYTIFDGAVLFTANETRELWKFVPGSDAELLKDVTEGTNGGVGEYFNLAFCGGCAPAPVVGGKLIFRARNELRGYELWSTDGTPAGTVPLEIVPGPAPSGNFFQQQFLSTAGGTLYFRADDETNGLELYRTDGTPAGTRLVEEIHPGPGHGLLQEDVTLAYDGKLVFTGVTPGEGPEPWISDGTEAGTHIVKDLVLGNDSSNINSLSAMKNKVVFSADDGVHGDEPWVSDGTEAGTRLLRNIVPEGPPRPLPDHSGVSYGSFPGNFFRFGKGLLFGASLSAECGIGSLFRTDGTPAGTLLVKAMEGNCYSYSYPSGFTLLESAVFFKGQDAEHGRELWRTNATSQGTFVVADIDPSDYYGQPASSEPGPIIQWQDGLIFAAATQADGAELWKFDRRRRQAVQIKDIHPGGEGYPNSSNPYGFTPLGNKIYFVAQDDQGSGLFRTNGEAAGTVLVKRVCPGCYAGPPGSDPYGPLVRVGNRLFFSSTDEEHGTELWVSDGTAAGTRMVVDLYPGDTYPNSSYPVNLTSFNGLLYFSTETPDKGRELWRSNGTAAGTVLVKDIQPGPGSSSPGGASYTALSGFLIASGRLYFSADDGVNGQELWRTDGTAAGTALVDDILPGPGSSAPASLTLAGGLLHFTAEESVPGDRVHGRELWALRPDPPRRP